MDPHEHWGKARRAGPRPGILRARRHHGGGTTRAAGVDRRRSGGNHPRLDARTTCRTRNNSETRPYKARGGISRRRTFRWTYGSGDFSDQIIDGQGPWLLRIFKSTPRTYRAYTLVHLNNAPSTT